MKKSRKQKYIEARKAADPLAQALGRHDIDYESDELPTAPRESKVIDLEPEPQRLASTHRITIEIAECLVCQTETLCLIEGKVSLCKPCIVAAYGARE